MYLTPVGMGPDVLRQRGNSGLDRAAEVDQLIIFVSTGGKWPKADAGKIVGSFQPGVEIRGDLRGKAVKVRVIIGRVACRQSGQVGSGGREHAPFGGAGLVRLSIGAGRGCCNRDGIEPSRAAGDFGDVLGKEHVEIVGRLALAGVVTAVAAEMVVAPPRGEIERAGVDLAQDRIGPYERRVIHSVVEAKPDLVLLAGDFGRNRFQDSLNACARSAQQSAPEVLQDVGDDKGTCPSFVESRRRQADLRRTDV